MTEPVFGLNTFTIRLRRSGPFWHATVTQGPMIIGEPGSSTYKSRSDFRCVRRAMKTVSGIAADSRMKEFTVKVEYPE